MEDLMRQAVVTLRGMWLRRWIGVAVAWVVAVALSVVIWSLPDRFESSAKIFVDTQSILRPVMTGIAVAPSVDQQAVLVSRTLISRQNIERLIESTDLEAAAKTKRDREILVEQLTRRLDLRMAGRENLYALTYWDTEAARAKLVVETLAGLFIDSTRGAERKDTSAAKQFVQEQIASYEAKLRDAETRLKDFRLRHLGVGDSGKDYFGKMDELNTNLTQARLELREAENSRDALARQITGEMPVILDNREVAQKPAVPELDSRIDSVQRNLDGLLQRYTEDHPDVVGAKRVLASLEEQRRKERALLDKGAPSRITSSTSNPVYQELKVSLAKSEASVASLRARVSEYDNRYRQYKDAARLVPQVEAEHAQLNRDYEINKKNYEALVARRESLEIGGDMQEAGDSQIRVVDPPRMPSRPIAPNRPLLFVAGILAALGAGVASSFAISRIWPRFFDPTSLREVTGLPVLGAISLRDDESSRRASRRSLLGFFSALTALIVGYMASVAAFLLMAARAG
jgi:polysaccharide chain length determinant protein (PEP-CTERM system associated)